MRAVIDRRGSDSGNQLLFARAIGDRPHRNLLYESSAPSRISVLSSFEPEDARSAGEVKEVTNILVVLCYEQGSVPCLRKINRLAPVDNYVKSWWHRTRKGPLDERREIQVCCGSRVLTECILNDGENHSLRLLSTMPQKCQGTR